MLRRCLTLVLLAPALFTAEAQEDLLPKWVVLLSRIKQRVAHEMGQLPEYTCLETVQRFTKASGAKAEMEPLDTVRLEVLYTGKKEMYSSPGEKTFRDDSPITYTGGGMIGDGIFAAHLHSIFLGGAAIFTWRGEEETAHERGWARAVKYDFRISSLQSGYRVIVSNASGIVGMKGSIWADPETYELLRLEIHADDIPPGLPVDDAITVTSYARMRIGSRDVMLPQTSELRLLETGGSEALDVFDFTHCRSYSAQSSISFGAPDEAPGAATRPGPKEVTGAIPAALTVPVTLTTELTDDAAVGMLIEGRVSGNVVVKGKTIIPDGAVVHGRVRRLERFADAGFYYVVGLEFTEIETESSLFRFLADLQTVTGAANVESSVLRSRRTEGNRTIEEHFLPGELPGVGSFILKGSKLSLPAGVRMVWRTRSLSGEGEKPARRR